VPNANDVEWVGFNCDYAMVFTDEDEIGTMIELHKNFLEDKKELRDVNVLYSDVPGNSFTIKYKLKNGKTIVRDYSVVDTESEEISAQYVAATEPILDFVNSPIQIKEHIIGNIYDDCTITEMSFSGYLYDEGLDDFYSTYVDFDYLTDREKQEKFARVYEALLKDVDDGKVFTTSFGTDYYNNEDKLYNDFSFTIQNKKTPYFSDTDFFWGYEYASSYVRYEQSIYVQLSRDCTNTLQALKEEGFYTDDEEILTYGEYNQRMGYDYY
jgi:ABC-2 type transport system permease protein